MPSSHDHAPVSHVQFHIVFGAGQLSGAFMQLASAKGGADRIFEILRRQPQIINHDGLSPSGPPSGVVDFRAVDFAYPTREGVKILHNFSLHVPADTTTALVGSSGCGKSTALALLLRFYECSAGTVSFDGVDVKALNASWLRSRMAFVQQEPILFGMTVGENVQYGITARAAALADMQSPSGALICSCTNESRQPAAWQMRTHSSQSSVKAMRLSLESAACASLAGRSNALQLRVLF